MARPPRPLTRIEPPLMSCRSSSSSSSSSSLASRLALCLICLSLLGGGCQNRPAPVLTPSASSAQALPSPTIHPTASPTHPPTPTPAASSTPRPPTATVRVTPTAAPVTTILFTGVIVPARCIQATLDENGNPDYLYEEVRHLIRGADLAVGALNATMSDRVAQTGCARTFQLVGRSNNADAAARAGFDLMSVATNHIKDCGKMKSWCDYAMLDTLDNLKRVGIQTVGAGQDLAQALQPVVFTIHGVRFGFVSLGDRKMAENIFARPDYTGIAELTPENIQLVM